MNLRPPTASLWSLSIATALLGFLLNLVGAIGGPFYLEPAQQREASLTREIALQSARAKMIRAATAADELAEHLRSLVFSISVAPNAPETVGATIREILTRAFERRHDDVRNYLAQLAVAGAVDFPTASREYEALVTAERANYNIDTYRAANAFEANLATRMVNAQGEAAIKAITLQGDRAKARRNAARRGMTLFIIAMLGSTLVFFATMSATARAKPEPVDAARASGAARLIANALSQLRARSAASQGEPA